jgi:hypothetical protein
MRAGTPQKCSRLRRIPRIWNRALTGTGTGRYQGKNRTIVESLAFACSRAAKIGNSSRVAIAFRKSETMSFNTTICIDFNTQPIYEIGAIMIAALCYSTPHDCDDDREKAVTALCALALRVRAQGDATWANTALPIKPCYAAQSFEEVDRVLKDVNRRMRDRLAAGRIVMPFLQKALTGELPMIGNAPMRPTVNKLAPFVLKDARVSDADNVKSRVWSPSRSVLHLAGAFEFAHDVLHKGGQRLDFVTMLWNETFVRFVLKVAEDAEGLIAKSFSDGDLKIDSATLIRLRVIDKKSRSEARAAHDPDLNLRMGDVIAHDTQKANPRRAG